MSNHDAARAVRELFDESEVRDVLRDTFWNGGPEPASDRGATATSALRPLAVTDRASPPRGATTTTRGKRRKKAKPDHYDVICISLYKEDLGRLDDKVAALKERGHRRMTRSALIRWALDQVDLSSIPKGI